MPRVRRPGALLIGLGMALAACVPVTVNIHFPQEKLEGAAGSIEDMVRGQGPPKPATLPPAPGSWLHQGLAALGPRLAAAQARPADVVPEIRVQTPELMKVIGSRRDRFPKIQGWKAKGCIGENNQGLLEARAGQGCSGEVSALIGAENRDRQFTYETLMQQNNIAPGDVARVRAAFAKANRDRAQPGEWIQQPSGQWTRR